LAEVFAALPSCVRRIFARADSVFYCWQAVEAYEKANAEFIMVARKTPRLVEQLQAADWKPSPKTDADQQCKFWHLIYAQHLNSEARFTSTKTQLTGTSAKIVYETGSRIASA
jgi:hypothetical protein